MSTFPHIFRPVTLRHKTLRNRIVFGAHTTNMATEYQNPSSVFPFCELPPRNSDDLPPEAPSFITRVCGPDFHIIRCGFGQARRARSFHVTQRGCRLRLIGPRRTPDEAYWAGLEEQKAA